MLKHKWWIFAGSALISAQLHIDPDTLDDRQWCHHLKMAEWMEARGAQQIAKLIAR